MSNLVVEGADRGHRERRVVVAVEAQVEGRDVVHGGHGPAQRRVRADAPHRA